MRKLLSDALHKSRVVVDRFESVQTKLLGDNEKGANGELVSRRRAFSDSLLETEEENSIESIPFGRAARDSSSSELGSSSFQCVSHKLIHESPSP
jgi:hypothetical protein